ncbi:MAG TPA: flagellar basal body P-ring formation chaperone FlgA [Rhizomicrobium sp.]|nr:flagellar basal body P-ring formation chaperone FlgA [Rhizomicrobium sp.]
MKMLALALALSLAAFAPASAAEAVDGPRIVVPAHDIERGETITDTDLVMQTIAPDRMRPGVITAMANLVGHEARRTLREGEPVRAEDVRMPILVVKGTIVTMTFMEPGIVLTATGRAMADAGLGESVVVQNPVSFRQVSCIVTGAGAVRATEPQGSTIAANP